MAQKIPPPTFLTGGNQPPDWQAFNRWLLEVTSVLSNEGGIDPNEVTGLPATITQVVANTAAITALQGGQGSQAGQIAVLHGQVVGLTASVATINGQITTLNARNQVFNGAVAPVALHADGDYYVDTVLKHLYVQVAGVWTLIV